MWLQNMTLINARVLLLCKQCGCMRAADISKASVFSLMSPQDQLDPNEFKYLGRDS